jgi:hypothetical protein
LLQHFGSSQSRFITIVEEAFPKCVATSFSQKRSTDCARPRRCRVADIANAEKEAARRAQEIVSKDVLQGVSAVSRMIIIADDELHTVTELPF